MEGLIRFAAATAAAPIENRFARVDRKVMLPPDVTANFFQQAAFDMKQAPALDAL